MIDNFESVPTSGIEAEQERIIKNTFPFLDDAITIKIRDRLHEWNVADSKDYFHDPYQVREAFYQITSEMICEQYPNLNPVIVRAIQRTFLDKSMQERSSLFLDSTRIADAYQEVSKLPLFSEDINELLLNLQNESDPKIIILRLVQLVVRIRENRELRSAETTEGDNVVAQIEPNTIKFLDLYKGKDFEEIYSRLHELVGITPKLDVFGIDIKELRDGSAEYHENRRQDNPFSGIAEYIRERIHRRLSVKAVKDIDNLIDFLNSDDEVRFIADCYCKATREEKDEELSSPLFQILLKIRRQLNLIWNNPFLKDQAESREFLSDAVILIKKIISPYTDLVHSFDRGPEFLEYINQTVIALERLGSQKLQLGLTRYYLKNLIADIMRKNTGASGRIIFNLITLDLILENLSFIYYADVVNAELANVTNDNYEKAMQTLVDLTLCARATGQGTKTLGRFSFLLRKYIQDGGIHFKKEKVNSVVAEMNNELTTYILQLRGILVDLLQASKIYDDPRAIERANIKILNDIIREKTTHLLGNLLDNIREYLGRADKETIEQLEKAQIRSSEAAIDRELKLSDMVFEFGPDIKSFQQTAKNAWFMGGKGASLAEISRLILSEELYGVDVPKGFGLSTQTGLMIKDKPKEKLELRNMIRTYVKDLELRTGKKFGDAKNPLLLITRSGAIISMPGILSTIGHIGLNEKIVKQWLEQLPEPEKAYHAYIRFLFNYVENILNIKPETILERLNTSRIADLCGENLGTLQSTVKKIKNIVKKTLPDTEIPDEPYKQLFDAVDGVFRSYEKEDIQRQVKIKHIPPKYQTACVIQECLPLLTKYDCSGVFFTRNPRTGGRGQIEFVNQFGEDLVGGRVKPKTRKKFKILYPEQHAILEHAGEVIEGRYTNPNDIEFAIRNEKVFIVQTRKLILTPVASVIVNYQFFKNGKISVKELVWRTKRIVNQPLINTCLDERETRKNPPIASGEPISGGVVCGRIIFDESEIKNYPNEPIIFLTKSNLPRDTTTQPQICGYVSEEGGVTSHAALVSIGKVSCIVGVDWIKNSDGKIIIGNVHLKQGDFVTLDANDGYLYAGKLSIHKSQENNPDFIKAKEEILKIAAELGVDFAAR